MSTSVNRLATLLGSCAMLSGCMLGPNFSRPAAPSLNRYGNTALPAMVADGVTQTPRLGTSPDQAWWHQFGSPALDALVASGLAGSPTLTSASAALDQSRDLARAGAGVFFPQVNATADATREHTAPALLDQTGSGSTFSLYTASGTVSYTLDLFGGERRGVEALRAQADYQRHALGAAWLLLAGNIVNAAIAHAGYTDDCAVLSDIVRMDAAQRDMLNARYTSGYGAWADVLVAEQQLAADRESLAVTQQHLAASTTLLNMLTGREPAAPAPPPPALGDLTLPADLPVSLPSELVHQRPDILEAEATVHQANAQIGVATAAMYPSISLTGSYGAASTALSRLTGTAGRFWSIGPGIDIPIFHGGQLRNNRRAAQAAHTKALADYRQTVLAALEQVADSLYALDTDARIAAASRTAFDAASANHTLGRANFSAGVIAEFDAMTLALVADRARLVLTGAKAQRLQDVVALDVASGGGWTGALPSGALPASGARP